MADLTCRPSTPRIWEQPRNHGGNKGRVAHQYLFIVSHSSQPDFIQWTTSD